jgi:ATP-dependent DNA helicase RecG
METALQKLGKVLELERQGGFKNRAVIGGIERYIPTWIEDARAQASTEREKALVEQIGQLLADYGELPGPEARARLIKSIQERLEDAVSASAVSQVTAAGRVNDHHEQVGRVIPPAAEEGRAPRGTVPATPPEGLGAALSKMRGIGPKTADMLEKLGLHTIEDLITHFPRHYIDYSTLRPINRLRFEDQVTVIGTVWETSVQTVGGRRKVVRSIIGDGTATIQCTWFNQPWLADKLKTGVAVMISGKVDQYLGRLTFTSPEWELVEKEQLHTGRLVPVYSLTGGLSAKMLRTHIKRTVDYWAPRIPDHLPDQIRQRQKLMRLDHALAQIHYPDDWDQAAQARRRFAFDELLLLQIGLFRLRRQWQSEPGIPLRVEDEWLESFLGRLPYELTGAQARVLGEIRADMASEIPMNRLLQGDVGSGKTVVAATAMAIALEARSQSALMAPTEILAEQHADTIARILGPERVRLLTGSIPPAEKQVIYEELADGAVDAVVGTHALIQEGVGFKNLGLVIVDEQHRFGVEQRAALKQKGHNPHVLVMTATPIPRTLALTIYGDLDVSVIDEMPPGRQEVKTYWLDSRARERAYGYIRKQVKEGRQAFIICPLIESSDSSESKAATEEYERLQGEVFPRLKLGLLHGRMKAEEKEASMAAFYRGETDILVSTSVVEVGIDVPNATVMLVEGANRFGLAQLHQFRGRVGRGTHESICILLADTVTPDAEVRLAAMAETNDGFVLAQKDLELRGPGEFFGTRQSGLPDLKMADVLDLETLEQARQEASTLFDEDPLLGAPEHRLLAWRVDQFWSQPGDVS